MNKSELTYPVNLIVGTVLPYLRSSTCCQVRYMLKIYLLYYLGRSVLYLSTSTILALLCLLPVGVIDKTTRGHGRRHYSASKALSPHLQCQYSDKQYSLYSTKNSDRSPVPVRIIILSRDCHDVRPSVHRSARLAQTCIVIIRCSSGFQFTVGQSTVIDRLPLRHFPINHPLTLAL